MSQRIVVAGAIVRDGRVLLAKRARGKAIAPGKWHLPGGHVEFGEQPDEALMRELEEELGVKTRVGMPVDAFSYVWRGRHTVGIAFYVEIEGDAETLGWDRRDIEALEWVAGSALNRYLDADDHNLAAAVAALGQPPR